MILNHNNDSGLQKQIDELNQSLTLDYSNASEDVRDVNTLLQNLLNRFYPNVFHYITKGVCVNSFTRLTGDGSFAKTNDYLLFSGATSNTVWYAPIDVTNFSTLKVEVEGVTNNNGTYAIFACDGNSTSTMTNQARLMQADRQIISIDVRSLSGTAYFKINGWASMGCKIHNAWLEP